MFHSTLSMRKVHSTELAYDAQGAGAATGAGGRRRGVRALTTKRIGILPRDHIPYLDIRTATAGRQARIFNLVGWESLSASTDDSI